MVKHTQTICRQLSMNCLSVFHHFVGFALEGLTPVHRHYNQIINLQVLSNSLEKLKIVKHFEYRISPFHTSGLFLYPQKITENL